MLPNESITTPYVSLDRKVDLKHFCLTLPIPTPKPQAAAPSEALIQRFLFVLFAKIYSKSDHYKSVLKVLLGGSKDICQKNPRSTSI